MEVIPYTAFGNVRLRENEQIVAQRLGVPDRRKINSAGEVELDYSHIVVRIDGICGVVEVTSRPEHICIGQDVIRRHHLPGFLMQHDPSAKEIQGFVVSPRFGVAVDTDTVNDGWISVFVEGRWDETLSEA